MTPAPRPPGQQDWLAGPAEHSLFEPTGHADAAGFPGPASPGDSGAVTVQPDWGSAAIGTGHLGWGAEPTHTSQPDWEAQDRASQPDWDAASHPSQPDWDVQGRISQPDWVRPEQATPASDYDSDAPSGEPADWRNESDWPSQPRAAASGLPIRPARPAGQPSAAPLSPSGSLWEPVDGDAGSYSGEPEDAGGRQIFVWSPAAQQESYPALPAELYDAQPDRGLPE
jgi:hypothetical protein